MMARMAEALIECIPNVSEGRDQKIIRELAQVVSAVPGVTLLHVDPGHDAHRTVMTYVGAAPALLDASFELLKLTLDLIDLRQHRGMHPRMGALDVCPFVPLAGSSMADCIALSEQLGRRVADRLKIPVYLYEKSARREERRALPDVRRGEFEGLEEKLKDPDWLPDFGPTWAHPQVGALITGAREFLVAFNLNLDTRDVKIAQAIAAKIRTSGVQRRHPDGSLKRVPGELKACRAIGWLMPTYNCAQVSMNLYDLKLTNMREAYDACALEAKKLGVKVQGSELIGLVPLGALQKVMELPATERGEAALTEAAARVGLTAFKEFSLRERVLEFSLEDRGVLSPETKTNFFVG